MNFMPGTTIGTFVTQRDLGQGSLGRAYCALEPASGKLVRLKILREEVASDASLASRLAALAERLRQIKSPNLLRLAGCQRLPSGQFCVASEWTGGEPLLSFLSTAEWPWVLEMLRQVAALLATAHALGESHLGLRPSKIMVVGRGSLSLQIRLQDLGLLAQLDKPPCPAALPLETQRFLAPEQQRSELVSGVSAAADVYAFGQLLDAVRLQLTDVFVVKVRAIIKSRVLFQHSDRAELRDSRMDQRQAFTHC